MCSASVYPKRPSTQSTLQIWVLPQQALVVFVAFRKFIHFIYVFECTGMKFFITFPFLSLAVRSTAAHPFRCCRFLPAPHQPLGRCLNFVDFLGPQWISFWIIDSPAEFFLFMLCFFPLWALATLPFNPICILSFCSFKHSGWGHWGDGCVRPCQCRHLGAPRIHLSVVHQLTPQVSACCISKCSNAILYPLDFFFFFLILGLYRSGSFISGSMQIYSVSFCFRSPI